MAAVSADMQLNQFVPNAIPVEMEAEPERNFIRVKEKNSAWPLISIAALPNGTIDTQLSLT